MATKPFGSRVEILPGTPDTSKRCCGAPAPAGHKPDCPGLPDEVELFDPEEWKELRRGD